MCISNSNHLGRGAWKVLPRSFKKKKKNPTTKIHKRWQINGMDPLCNQARLYFYSLQISDVRIRILIRIGIHIQAILGWIQIRIQTLKSLIRILIQEKIGGFGFESGLKLLVADHNPTQKYHLIITL